MSELQSEKGVLIQETKGKPAFLAVKNFVGLRKFWFRLLQLSQLEGISWESEFARAEREESLGPELYRIFGKLPFESEFIAFNCLYFSYQMIIFCEEVVVEVDKNHIFLQNSAIYSYVDDEFILVGEQKDRYLTSPETPLEICDEDLVEGLHGITRKLVEFSEDGNLSFKEPFDTLKNEFKLTKSSVGKNFWEASFGDIEALIEMSPLWGINNNFTY